MKYYVSTKARVLATVAGILGTAMLSPVVARAASSVTLGDPSNALSSSTDLPEMIGNIINVLLSFLAVIAVVLFVYAGFLWMTAAGDEEKVGKAKSIITACIIGLVIIFISYSASTYVISTLNEETGSSIGL